MALLPRLLARPLRPRALRLKHYEAALQGGLFRFTVEDARPDGVNIHGNLVGALFIRLFQFADYPIDVLNIR